MSGKTKSSMIRLVLSLCWLTLILLFVQALSHVQEFLSVPERKLVSRQVKIHTRPLPEQVTNWEDVSKMLNGTRYEHFLGHSDYGG